MFECVQRKEGQNREKLKRRKVAHTRDDAASMPHSPFSPTSKLSHDSHQQDHIAVIDKLVECRRSVGGKDAQCLCASVR